MTFLSISVNCDSNTSCHKQFYPKLADCHSFIEVETVLNNTTLLNSISNIVQTLNVNQINWWIDNKLITFWKLKIHNFEILKKSMHSPPPLHTHTHKHTPSLVDTAMRFTLSSSHGDIWGKHQIFTLLCPKTFATLKTRQCF